MRNTIHTKSDVQTHSDGTGWRQSYPALNVKLHNMFDGHVDAIQEKFSCSEKQAQIALDMAVDSSTERFWEDTQDTSDHFFGKTSATVYSEGRSNGWLVVIGLPSIESWDAIQLMKWRRFAKCIDQDIEYRCAINTIIEDIEANQWWKEGAEQYNFIDQNGETKCIADMKQEAIKAGFGPVLA